jgi:hypothetical protein
MALNNITDPHWMVVVYDAEEGGYACLAHNLNKWDSSRLDKRLRDQYDLDSHVIAHRVRHDGVGDAGECEACHAMLDDIIEEAQGMRGSAETAITVITPDDGSGMARP